MTEPDRLTRAAEAIAALRRASEHSQRCPVWVSREHGAVVGDCDCWILTDAREDAQAALAAANAVEH